MAFFKYGDKEKIDILTEKESEVIESFKEKTGKRIEDLDDEERDEFRGELDGS